MSQILGIKFSDHGPVCYFASGAHVLRTGQSVLVETDQGLALGRVVTVSSPEAGAHVFVVQPAGQPGNVSVPPTVLVAASVAQPAPAPFEDSLGSADWDEVPLAEMAEAAWPDEAAEPSGPGAGPVALFASDQAAAQPVPHSLAGLQLISRLATEADLEAHAENRRLARRAFSYCRGCIHGQNLDMKLVDVEVLHDRSKFIFFFTAPNRIDFRELIKSLVREFHTRIELRQIGVRHETQMIGAIGNCGQVCCCRRFLRKFAPVTIKMAKEQNLFLNPAKISGICGRLLCCLSYEQKGYEEFHKQCPKIGKRLQTPVGSVKVLRANFFKKSISVWVEDLGEREYTLDEWKEMLGRQPGDAQPETQAAEAQGRQAPGRSASRMSTGRPARPERAARPERTERPERGERPERSSAPEAQGAPNAPGELRQESGESARNATSGQSGQPGQPDQGQARERQRPRRKRRKGKGPKPAQ